MRAPEKPRPVPWLLYLVSALTFFAVLQSVGTLLKQVQQSGSDLFGGMESLGSGLLPMSAIQRTQSLLQVWHEANAETPDVRSTIIWTAGVYTATDVLFIVCYTALLVGVCRWLADRAARRAAQPGAQAAGPEGTARDQRWGPLRKLVASPGAIGLPMAVAVADLAENGIRLGLIWHAFAPGDGSAPTWVVATAWVVTSAKFVLLGLSLAVLLLLVRESDVVAGRWAAIGWSLWRLRIPVGAVLIFVAMVLGDPTGQTADLIRRWLDNWWEAGIGLAAIIGAGLLGFTVWLITRRIVLADQRMTEQVRHKQDLKMTAVWLGVLVIAGLAAKVVLGWKTDRNTLMILMVGAGLVLAVVFLPGRRPVSPVAKVATDWRTILLVATVAAWVVSTLARWGELRAAATVASVVLVLEVIAFVGDVGFRNAIRELRDRCRHDPSQPPANESREADIGQPERTRYRITQLIARLVAVAAPVALLIAAAGAIAPVPLVLSLSERRVGQPHLLVIVAFLLLAPAIVAVAGYAGLRGRDRALAKKRLAPLEGIYELFVPIIVLGAAFGLIGGAAGWPFIGPVSIVAAFLATMIIVLGEAQLWSDTHAPPQSFLLAGFTRVPPVALLVLISLVGGFAFSDGTGHQVPKSGPLPSTPAFGAARTGVDLAAAFASWVTANCADASHRGSSVPLILVAAPGGGLRAAYWTASTLTDLFGPTAAPGTSCPKAPPSYRVFAVGGASGGSLGELAWLGGLDSGDRPADWYDAQLAEPDFLTDPLAWLLTVDLARTYLGFHGEDRAHRLETLWAKSMPPLARDFFHGSWGAEGQLPLSLLTGTQVETGCRLNVSGLRVTEPEPPGRESSCTTVHEGPGQKDAPATSDLLDYLCAPARGSDPQSINRSTAALLSARFPWVSPSGQLDRCAEAVAGQSTRATRISVVDGGYADNTGMGLLLDLWPRLEVLIAEHNAGGKAARIVPVFLEVDNHYAAVAAPGTPDRTAETLVPPLTKDRPDKLDDLTMRARIEAAFAGPVPGTQAACRVDLVADRYVRVSPKISPGLPAPLAWTLSDVATQDLRNQRIKALRETGPARLRAWAAGTPPAGCAAG